MSPLSLPDDPELETYAEEFLTLWQKQLSLTLLENPDVLQLIIEMMAGDVNTKAVFSYQDS